ncbi:uncharacterized protein ACHE_11334S [Aspergillus chevalieri]|uniref:Uncharacterized protein n=1 Tax=Aspergillus chevalieri TaxID=182096 RepID=A0A7R7VGK7_ASPCH|nr:uncharacterized protein ACHE_11334S [Aspergillus chevalieri]BCR83932.1 hypothetical protein ACHE_11334S [Aspergillus chevalieri]
MSAEKKNNTRMTNGVGNQPNGNANHEADRSNAGVVGQNRLSAADEPYFAHTRMHDRSEHVSRLSSQINRTDEILKT